ncbi:MAG: chorismate synthase [Acidaminobacteraceae bacterium]
MSCIWNNSLKLSIFGESHGVGIGIVIDGIPPGIKLDFEKIKVEMNRRRPGKDKFSTARMEFDEFEILSGYFNEHTTGTPLSILIKNTSQNSKDYSETKDIVRPSHADYTGHVRYDGYNDYRGGGHFSGRITAPLVFAGSLAKQILEIKNIQVYSYISAIGDQKSDYVDSLKLPSKVLSNLDKEFPVLDKVAEKNFKEAIIKAKEKGDSIGGKIRCIAYNAPVGLGNPFFESMESKIASLAFSVPAVKGIEFGKGFDLSELNGSLANDQMEMHDDIIGYKSNNNGGILGGITSGMPIDFTVAIKPTPSIFMEQDTVDMQTLKDSKLAIEGRHDPCIVQRAAPVIESVMALAVLDGILSIQKLGKWWSNE